MNEEVKNNENKKKQKVMLLIGLVTLLIAVLGATYAYFQINTNNESSNTNITGSTPPKSLVTLKGVTSNLHLNISASDMSLANANKEYYATDVEAKSYEDNETDGTKTIASVELTGGEATTKYSCTAKLTVSKVTEEENADTMIEVLQPGDMILQFKGNIISEKLDLSELKTTGSKEYNLKFKVTGNTPEEIQAYIKLVNKEEQQNYLAGKKLNIDINTSDLKCEIFIPDPKIAQLRADDTQGYLSEELQGGMYRYQAAPADENEAAQMTNWICFGTKENCGTDETDSDSNNIPDDIDKYMYRIIGITEEGEMYLLKETFLKEGETNTFKWHNTSSISNCLGDKCEWPNVDLYKRLNGETSNGSPIFVDSSEYEYMAKDGDWYNLIADHEWMYGDTKETKYNGNAMYAIETGKVATKRYWPDEETQTTCSSDNQCTEKDYTWSKRTDATKIGLMYMHDIDYAYTDGNPGSATDVKNSWIHFQKDGYNKFANYDYEWLTTRFSVVSASITTVLARTVRDNGLLSLYDLSSALGARPVFYLSSKAKIADGDGTKGNPYMLEI